MNRRGFLTAAALASLSACAPVSRRAGRGAYEPLRRMPDQDGHEVLALPEGFRYVTFGRTGEPMSDGSPTPRAHDGMACFAMPGRKLRLIRNHELAGKAGDFTLGVGGDPATRYDARAAGGCVSIDFDPAAMRPIRDFVSLNGTHVNCAGGLAYRDAGWLTCEEILWGHAQGFEQPHGYVFFVGRDWDRPLPAKPLVGLGRFVHEAAVADARGIVYQTEDAASAGFYRFIPDDPSNLAAGGRLQMLAIQGRPNYDTRTGQAKDVRLPVEWVAIDEPDPPAMSPSSSCFAQGFARGGATFRRLEGVHRGERDAIYFTSTSGGDAGRGQVWRYDAREETLTLCVESSGAALDGPDNLCVTPSGALLFCEDDDIPKDKDTHELAPGVVNVNRLVGLSLDGQLFDFAVNVLNGSEFAGVCFSPDGRILFANIYGDRTPGSGMTCAITGPWSDGPL